MKVDYSLYLVTDNTKPILGDRDILDVVRQAVEGGVTIVQLRDKTSETSELIRIGKELHKITQKNGIPLIINDRADVALAVGAEGLHIGQDDMDIASARKLLGPEAIIGVTASSLEEALEGAKGGADYLGIGTVYATPTKENSKQIIGPRGARSILTALSQSPHNPTIPTVLIGGLNATNLQRILYQTTTPTIHASGVALVSAIMASPSPRDTSAHLLTLIRAPPAFTAKALTPHLLSKDPTTLTSKAPTLLSRLASQKPLCHNITNTVVQNLAANVALALGGSPIMSANGHEAADLAALNGSLVLNMGTVTPDSLAHYTLAIQAYNAAGGPILFDPVGGGATTARRAAVKQLMAAGYFSVIKGNESEILTVLDETSTGHQQRGVDSGDSSSTPQAKASLAARLARRERCTVILTGVTDYLSDGTRTFAIHNGHHYLGAITGSGCTLGTTIAAFCAVEREDTLAAVLAGALVFEIAAERAVASNEGRVRGPGTFVPAFLDELYRIREETVAGDTAWVDAAKVEVMEVDVGV